MKLYNILVDNQIHLAAESGRGIIDLSVAGFEGDMDGLSRGGCRCEIEKILATLPGHDCGSCGSPTCRAFAHDILKGEATLDDCIVRMREKLKNFTEAGDKNDG